MQKPLPPFSCTYSPNIPELLQQLNCTLAITTYQAGKVIFLSASGPEDLVQLPRNFSKPMGLALKNHQMAIATKDEIVILANSPGLAPKYPKQPKTYDGLYIPRANYYCGEVDIHDMSWGDEGLWAVNTRFSCIALINDEYSFTPKWQPNFISKLAPEDRCHLNGMAMENGAPKYVTALGNTDTLEGWRDNKIEGGILMDIPSKEIIVQGLGMPHTPRLYDEKLYALLSATGELICVDVEKGNYEVVNRFDGFVRGMAKLDDYLFIGLSKLRPKSSAFRDLPIAKRSIYCGIVVIYLPKGSLVGYIKYENSVEELYDVQIIPEFRRPGLLSPMKGEHKYALTLPNDDFWAVTNPPEEQTQTVQPDPSSADPQS
ncbi:MAG: TIGR03032 family protein [Bacteroidetes bacterium]|nr:TIGR03032 family protein [Bacteroidota bacterium]